MYITYRMPNLPTSKSLWPFSPQSIPGLSLWLDAADRSSMTFSSGTTVTQWKDKSGNGNNATANTGITWAANGVGTNLPAMTFTGNQWFLGNISITGEQLTAFCIFNMTSLGESTPYSRILSLAAPDAFDYDSISYISIALNDEPSGQFLTWRNNEVSVVYITYGTNELTTTWADGSTLNMSQYGGEPNTTLGSSGNFNVSSYAIGSSTDTNDGHLYGYISEIIVYNSSLSTFQRQQVEGYLAQKWELQENLPTTNPYYATSSMQLYKRPVFQRTFQPVDIDGCVLWLDAADRQSLTLSGTDVTAWKDKSGSGYVATPIDSAITTTTLNGTPALLFGGNRMTIPNFTWNMSFTSIMVWNPYYGSQMIGLTASTNPAAAWYDYISTGNWALIYLNAATSSTDPNYIRGPTDPYPGAPAPVVTGNQWFIFSIGYTAGTTTITNYAVNGSARTANAVTAQTGTNTGAYFINGLSNGAYDYSQIGEIIHYNTSLNNSERQQVESYLAWKWGLTSLLPSTHPGKLLPSFSTVFTPKSLTGLQLWLDAADSTSLSYSGSNVTAWGDKSGNGYNMNTLPGAPIGYSQTSPTTGTAINRLNTVYFLPGAGLEQATTLDGVKNLYWVGRIDTTGVVEGGANAFFLLGQEYAYDWHADYPGGYYINSIYGQLGIQNATPVSQYGGGAAAAVNTTFSALQFPASGSVSLVSAAGITGSTLYQGICYDRTTHCGWSGDLAEVIIFSEALTPNQHQQVEGYLAWKWGLQNNLPDTHAYKKFSP